MITTIHLGEPLRHKGLSIFPLFHDDADGVDYQLSDEAIGAGTVIVAEVSEGGNVPELIVENRGDRRVLFLEGEELVGAKQNRILNTSVLVPAKSKITLPVSCVERGRWHFRSRQFGSSDHHSSPSLRYLMARSVTLSVEAKLGHRSDQGQVWKEVARQQEATHVASGTEAMSDTYASHQSLIEEFRQRLSYVEGAAGMAVALGKKLVALDVFDKPETCRKAWGRLLSGFVIDTLVQQPGEEPAETFDAQRMVDLLGQVPWQSVEAVGEGQEFRAELATNEHATKLCLGDSVVHAAVLAAL